VGGLEASRRMLRERWEKAKFCRSIDFGGIGGGTSEKVPMALHTEDGLELYSDETGEDASERVGVVICVEIVKGEVGTFSVSKVGDGGEMASCSVSKAGDEGWLACSVSKAGEGTGELETSSVSEAVEGESAGRLKGFSLKDHDRDDVGLAGAGSEVF